MTSASPTPAELDALYDEIGDVIARPRANDVRDSLRAFFVSFRSYRVANERGGPAAMAAFANALAAYPAAREAVDALRAQGSATEATPDTALVADGEPSDESTEPEAEAPASSMPVHPAAAIFPMMCTADLKKLADNIKEFGLREPIVVFEGRIVDGRNRKAACVLAGIEPTYREWDGEGSLVAWILSVNLHRRHLTDTQRAMIGARAREAFAAEAEERRNAKLVQNKGSTVSADLRYRELSRGEEGKSAEVAAAQLQVSTRAVEQASAVIAKGSEALVEALTSGAVSLDAASTVASLPADEQKRLVEEGAVRAKAAEMRRAKKQAREAAKKLSDSSATPDNAPIAADMGSGPIPGRAADNAGEPERDARIEAIESTLGDLARACIAVAALVPEHTAESTCRVLEGFVSAVMNRPDAHAPEVMRELIASAMRALFPEPKGRSPGRPTEAA